jgi:hypothetical protein
MGALFRHFLRGMAGAVCIFPSRDMVPPEKSGDYFQAAGDRIFFAIESDGPAIRAEAAQLELQFNEQTKAV